MADVTIKEIKKEMSNLCEKIDGLCDGNDTCGGCPVNDNFEQSIKAYQIIRDEILKSK
jgi:hypothetical protein